MIRFPCERHPISSEQYIESLRSGPAAPAYREVCDGGPELTPIRVGVSPGARARLPGPLGNTDWSPIQAGGRQQYIQETTAEVYPLAMIDVGIDQPVTLSIHNATHAELQILNNTFCRDRLVPMAHLRRIHQVRPEGIHVADYRGPAGAARYTGGTNLEDRIVLTRGSLWAYRNIGVNLTILHEIGHVLTNPHRRFFLNISREDALTLNGTSENNGLFEGACDEYMCLLCYASEKLAIRRATNQGTLAGRNFIRATRAIRNLDRDQLRDDWQDHFRERP